MKKLLLGMVVSTDEHESKSYYEVFTNNIFEFDKTLDKKTKKAFCKNFKRITKSAVGRRLLSKVLEEIHKRKDTSTFENKLYITQDRMGFSTENDLSRPVLQFATDRINACVIDPKIYEKSGDHVELSPDIKDNLHIHLFHELCHWYHFLRNPGRKRQETDFQGNILDHQLGRYYFEGTKPTFGDQKREIQAEVSIWNNGGHIAIEEIRTIFGAPRDENYEEGDELCENLYRTDIGAPLRYGHVAYDSYHIQLFKYRADIGVVERAIAICEQNR